MPETVNLENPIAVINTLTARIKDLEASIERQDREHRAALPSQMKYMLKWMRARAVIPLYVGTMPDNKVKMEFVGDRRGQLVTDEIAAEVLDQVWFLSGAPMPEDAKDALRKAAQNGMSRW